MMRESAQSGREADPALAAIGNECVGGNAEAVHSSRSEVDVFNDQMMVDLSVVLDLEAGIKSLQAAN